MDEKRRKQDAYEYLCRLQEVRKYVFILFFPYQQCISSWCCELLADNELPSAADLDEHLRNGVLLARIGHCIAPSVVSLNRIYDIDESRYGSVGV
jgi:hypothetical protein